MIIFLFIIIKLVPAWKFHFHAKIFVDLFRMDKRLHSFQIITLLKVKPRWWVLNGSNTRPWVWESVESNASNGVIRKKFKEIFLVIERYKSSWENTNGCNSEGWIFTGDLNGYVRNFSIRRWKARRKWVCYFSFSQHTNITKLLAGNYNKN